ncbi:MAG: hypothetical protein KatS3mg010_2010 [Acidimicrobiia bacterium]|nr:MAG: hypothetical protein KatS3mg010_2010 [Acidimicrobiia bacterium]
MRRRAPRSRRCGTSSRSSRPRSTATASRRQAVWASIERAIEDAPQLDLDAAVRARPPARSLRLPVAAAVLVAVAAAGVVGGLLAANGRDGDDGVLDVAEAANAALGEPGTARVQARRRRRRARGGTVVVTDDGTGFFLDPALDPLAPGRTYQLWALAGSSRPPVSVAVLGPDARPATFPRERRRARVRRLGRGRARRGRADVAARRARRDHLSPAAAGVTLGRRGHRAPGRRRRGRDPRAAPRLRGRRQPARVERAGRAVPPGRGGDGRQAGRGADRARRPGGGGRVRRTLDRRVRVLRVRGR